MFTTVISLIGLAASILLGAREMRRRTAAVAAAASDVENAADAPERVSARNGLAA